MTVIDRRPPVAGSAIRAEPVYCKKGALHIESVDDMFVFDEADGVEDTESDEIVLCFGGDNHLDDLAGGLIEGLDGGQVVSVRQRHGLAQDAFISVWIDIESEDLAAKSALDDDGLAGAGSG